MSSNRHNISNDFIIQDIQNDKDEHFSLAMKHAEPGGIPCEKNVLLAAQSNEFFLFDATYSADSSASPFSFWSGTQDSAFSVSIWYHPTDAPSSNAGVVSKGQWSASAKREWAIFHLTNGKILVQLYDESADSYIGRITSSAISNDAWHHIVVTYSGSETSAGIKIYVDGSASGLTTYETEYITAVAGVRGAEAEDEALHHLCYRKSMKGIALVDLQKAYGKLKIKRDEFMDADNNHPKLKQIDNLLAQLKIKMKKV